MSRFAVFSNEGKCLGSGKTEDEAVEKACETLHTADGWVQAHLVEYIRGDQDSSVCWLHPDWNGSHLTGVS